VKKIKLLQRKGRNGVGKGYRRKEGRRLIYEKEKEGEGLR
jgi:hypothetical protein